MASNIKIVEASDFNPILIALGIDPITTHRCIIDIRAGEEVKIYIDYLPMVGPHFELRLDATEKLEAKIVTVFNRGKHG